MIHTWFRRCALILVTALLAACGGSSPTTPPAPAAAQPTTAPSSLTSPLAAGAYPAPNATNGYPAPAAPAPAATRPVEGPRFTIDLPVRAGATEVTGDGPAGVPILLVDVSLMGDELSSTTIDRNGRFRFRLEEGLPAGHSIGLRIGRLEGTGFNYSDYRYSPTYHDRPLIGILLDIASVTTAE